MLGLFVRTVHPFYKLKKLISHENLAKVWQAWKDEKIIKHWLLSELWMIHTQTTGRVNAYLVKFIRFVSSVCTSTYLVFLNWQLMLTLASFGEEYLVFLNWRSCRHCLQNEWPLVAEMIHIEYMSHESWDPGQLMSIFIYFFPSINCRCFNAFTLWSDFHGKFAILEVVLSEQRNQALLKRI